MKRERNKYDYILRYVYALAAVVATAAVALIVTLYTGHLTENSARDRIEFYYLASAALAGELQRDIQQIDCALRAASGETAPAAGSRELAPRTSIGVSGALYSIHEKLTQLQTLQDRYAGGQLVATLTRLADRVDVFERSLAASPAATPTAETFAALELTVEQLYRLHLIAAGDALAGIQAGANRFLPNLAVLAAIVLTAALVGWFVMRLLRQSLARQVATEKALADSQERIHHMQKLEALGRLVGGVAHDFNNLLTAVLGQASLLRAREQDDPRKQQMLDEIIQAGRQAASLTTQLLAYSRRQPIEPQLLDLNELIRGIEPMLRRLIGEDIELNFDYGNIDGAVEVDPGQMRQVILNLFINARDALPNGGSVSLTTDTAKLDSRDPLTDGDVQQAGRYARVVIVDNGVGMSQETRERAFEPFFTTKERGRGTGLGLATVHGTIAAANGKVLLDSSLGEGARFEIYLPVSTRRPQAEISDSPPAIEGSETVLVVEDEEQIRAYLEDGLGALGYTVLTADSGAAGLETCARMRGEIDVIVSDVVLPGMNGREFMEAARPLQPGAVGIYMSGYTDDVVIERGAGQAEIPLIHKPFDIGALTTLIRARLSRRRAPALAIDRP